MKVYSKLKERGRFIYLQAGFIKSLWQRGFLEGALLKRGFDRKWVGWIMSCMCSVKFSILVNGRVTDAFSLTRGLW
jgi:hypothetical protein